MFLRIDNWLFDKVFQPIADWFMDTYGCGPFWLAATCAYAIAASAVMHQIFFVSDFSGDAFMFFFGIYKIIVNDRRSRLTNIYTATANPLKVDLIERIFRIMFVLTVACFGFTIFIKPTNALGLIFIIQGAGLVCCYYFEACDTKPPKPKEKKQAKTVATAATP